jgi:Fe-S-cluster containining protein
VIPFARTQCACDEDIANCRKRPGMLIPSDVGAIAEYLVALGVIASPEEVTTYLRATPGAVFGLLLADAKTILTHRVPTISPATTDGSRCIFLTKEERCLIHPVAPSGCAFFDVHQPIEEATRRSTWLHARIEETPAYTDLRATLLPKETPCPSLP